jgi:hypothetical protein
MKPVGLNSPSIPVTNRQPVAPQAAAPAPAPAAASAITDSFVPSVAAAAPAQSAATPSPADVANKFYTAFQSQDLQAMQQLYAPQATFHDPIYDLSGRDAVAGMWKGVLGAGKDVKLNYQVLSSNDSSVQVKWTADYKLGGRPIHNESVTTMQVKNGQIVSQSDDWSWSKWAKQAFPLGGLVDVPLVKSGLRFLLNKFV